MIPGILFVYDDIAKYNEIEKNEQNQEFLRTNGNNLTNSFL